MHDLCSCGDNSTPSIAEILCVKNVGAFVVCEYLPLSFLDRTCPDDCTNPSQGICDTSTGICDCKPGFAGLNCAGNIKHYTYKKFWS